MTFWEEVKSSEATLVPWLRCLPTKDPSLLLATVSLQASGKVTAFNIFVVVVPGLCSRSRNLDKASLESNRQKPGKTCVLFVL